MREGWDDQRRIHGCIVHAEIRNGKIWMHYDGIEDSITEDLVSAGIPKNCIVLAFHPADVRVHTGYAIAWPSLDFIAIAQLVRTGQN